MSWPVLNEVCKMQVLLNEKFVLVDIFKSFWEIGRFSEESVTSVLSGMLRL